MPSIALIQSRSLLCLLLLAAWCVVPHNVAGQETATTTGGSPYVELPAPPDEEELVRKGIALEQTGQWAPAIEHYEKALESFPENKQLVYGARRSRINYGIHRRYSDASFERSMLTKGANDALTVFDEIYGEIRKSYHEPISITSFTAHGTESLYLALSNDKFLAANLPDVDRRRVAEVRETLRDQYWNRNVEASGAGHRAIKEVCLLARTKLGLSESAVIMEYAFGGCNALDDYSTFLTPDRLDDLYGNIDGEFVGLGIEMQADNGQGMLLLDVLPDSPASTGGMRAGEYIVSINGIDCRSMSTDEAAKLLRGPTGSVVELEVIASTAIEPNPTPWQGRFVRKPVVVKSVDRVQMLDSVAGIGYLRMSGFQKSTASELDAALASLRRQGMRKLIWDLRGNPGGLLTASVEVLDRFIAEGVLVSTKGRSLDQNWTYSAHSNGTHSDIELAVLIDGNSASASEIVAGAIQDHKRGTLVGRTSYGKWSVQTIMPLRGQTGLRLTTAKFYSPNNHNYSKVGVKPDVFVENPLLDSGDGKSSTMPMVFGFVPERDADIQAAMRVLRGETNELTSR